MDTQIGKVYFEQSELINWTFIDPVSKILSTLPEKEIFIYPYSAYYYSFANKINPTRYNIIFDEYLTDQAKTEIINDLKNKQIKYILYVPTEYYIKTEQKFLTDWVKENYNEKKIKYAEHDGYFYLYTIK